MTTELEDVHLNFRQEDFEHERSIYFGKSSNPASLLIIEKGGEVLATLVVNKLR